MKALKIFLVLGWVSLAFLSFAQDLKDNPDYQKALELQASAQQALEEGNYDKAYEYASQAEVYALKLKAGLLIGKLENKLTSTEAQNIKATYPQEFSAVKDKLNAAKSSYANEDYTSSIANAEAAIADIATLEKLLANENIKPTDSSTLSSETATAKNEVTNEVKVVLPKYYVVRLIPANRDCLWKIAGYSFVYNDPTKWKILYEANKNKLPIPDNPDLILPEMIIEIPSLAGEIREGTYDPKQSYPTFGKK